MPRGCGACAQSLRSGGRLRPKLAGAGDRVRNGLGVHAPPLELAGYCGRLPARCQPPVRGVHMLRRDFLVIIELLAH